mmetsp:Transcript_31292/g.91646  ORF Transcript_31292/g.91646 Transcript_31292/m.91646 type:complete len:586 (+) Transcript_31292:264-2021(+)
MSSASRPTADLTIRVALARKTISGDDASGLFKELDPPVWRRFRVCSAVNLDLLADKILSPIMGWERNYHTYLFRKLAKSNSSAGVGDDRPDVVYLQEDTQATDLMHASRLHLDGRPTEPPESATIGDLLRKVGQQCLYTYDLGDSWFHVLTLESIDEEEDVSGCSITKKGSVELIDGAMRCPDEDGEGCDEYQSLLDLVLQIRSDPKDDDAVRELNQICFEEKRNAMNVLSSFKPDEFDLEARRRALAEGLSSRNSARNSVKQYGGMIDGRGFGTDMIMRMARIGQQSTITRVEQERGMIHQSTFVTFKETVNVKPDQRDGTLCYQCGAPTGRDDDTGALDLAIPLRGCGRCHTPRYCSKDCQAVHWTTSHKKQCKKFKKAFERYQQEVESGTTDPNRFDIPTEDRRLTRYDPDNLRFEPNTCVECMVGENMWQVGYVVQTLYQQDESWPVSAYQIFLPAMEKQGVECPFIHAPYDDDYQIRRVPHKDRYKSDQARKKFMGRVRYEWLPFLAGTRTSGSLGLEDKYNVWPTKAAGRKVRQFLNKCESGNGGDDDNDEGGGRAGQRRSRPGSVPSYKRSVEYAMVD